MLKARTMKKTKPTKQVVKKRSVRYTLGVTGKTVETKLEYLQTLASKQTVSMFFIPR